MTRDLTAAANAAAQDQQVRIVVLFEGDFQSGFARIASGDRDILFDSDGDMVDEIFVAVGDLGTISAIAENTDLQVSGVRATLTGIPNTFSDITASEVEHIQGRLARVWLAFLDADYALIADPVLVFRGRMDEMRVVVGEQTQADVTIEHRFADWDRPRVRRYTDQDQQSQFPGDKGFEFVSQTTEKEIIWGRSG